MSSNFADNCSIWRSGINISQIIHHLQLDLKLIDDWSSKWGFELNDSKSIGIVFTRKTKFIQPTLLINGNKIKFDTNVKFLGVFFIPN